MSVVHRRVVGTYCHLFLFYFSVGVDFDPLFGGRRHFIALSSRCKPHRLARGESKTYNRDALSFAEARRSTKLFKKVWPAEPCSVRGLGQEIRGLFSRASAEYYSNTTGISKESSCSGSPDGLSFC